MKKTSIVIALALATIITGCTTAKVTPATSTTPATTNYVVGPMFEAAIETARGINAATTPVNPYSGVIDWGLGIALTAAGWVAKLKNDSANKQALLLKTVIQGVENAGNPDVKATIQKQATAIGVEGVLGTTVQQINNGLL